MVPSRSPFRDEDDGHGQRLDFAAWVGCSRVLIRQIEHAVLDTPRSIRQVPVRVHRRCRLGRPDSRPRLPVASRRRFDAGGRCQPSHDGTLAPTPRQLHASTDGRVIPLATLHQAVLLALRGGRPGQTMVVSWVEVSSTGIVRQDRQRQWCCDSWGDLRWTGLCARGVVGNRSLALPGRTGVHATAITPTRHTAAQLTNLRWAVTGVGSHLVVTL